MSLDTIRPRSSLEQSGRGNDGRKSVYRQVAEQRQELRRITGLHRQSGTKQKVLFLYRWHMGNGLLPFRTAVQSLRWQASITRFEPYGRPLYQDVPQTIVSRRAAFQTAKTL